MDFVTPATYRVPPPTATAQRKDGAFLPGQRSTDLGDGPAELVGGKGWSRQRGYALRSETVDDEGEAAPP
jgi:hypothetical protein